jgi:lysozyme
MKIYLACFLVVVGPAGASTSSGCYVNETGVELVKHFEGFSPKAYIDHGNGEWTIGYGAQGFGIHAGTVWSEKRADKDVRKRLDKIVHQLCDVLTAPVTNNQLAALSSLAYNVGINGFLKSKLLMLINNLEFKEAIQKFSMYATAKGKKLKGLQVRRRTEVALFLTPDYHVLDIKDTAQAAGR